MPRILIVEDYESLGPSLRDYLSKEGYDTSLCCNLAQARASTEEEFDLIVLDWMLPDGQGLDLLSDLRRRCDSTPVIFLTARADIIDKVLGLEMGASDYVTKPFEPRELVARIRTRLRERRVQPGGDSAETPETKSVLRAGSLTIDRIHHKVTFRSRPIELVKKEFDLLVLFAEFPEKVFSREEILNKVWGYDVFPTTRTVDTHVMLLRQKVDEALIETVRAVGYRLKPI